MLFTCPKLSNNVFIEDLSSLISNNLINNSINYNLKEKDDWDDENYNILFDYLRYSIKSIREKVINDLKNKYENELDIDDYNKGYDYYEIFGYFK